MRVRDLLVGAAALAGAAGGVVAAATAASAGSTAPIVMGSTTGTPSANACGAMMVCTYVPFNSPTQPSLIAPSDGTITSFSVNSGSAAGSVELRVLRAAGGGKFTGAATSPAENLASGVNTYAVNVPVRAGDVLGLQNDSSALLFDTTAAGPITEFYESPNLADGATAAPDQTQNGARLLLSTTEQASGSTTTTTTSTTSTSTSTSTGSGRPPAISRVGESSSVWRTGGRRSRHLPPIGTTFTLALNEPATISLAFFAAGGCSGSGSCGASRLRGTVRVAGVSGSNRIGFGGRSPKLGSGSYIAVLTATDSAGRSSAPALLQFRVAHN